MILSGEDNKSFELWVMSYQYPNNKTDEYDSNWLTIGIKLKGFQKEWATSDPSLLTWELKFLTDWLQSTLKGNTEKREIEFIEPNLKFQLIDTFGDRFKIKTILTLESKPNWYTEDETFSFDLIVDHRQIENSVERLRNDLINFPARAGVKLI